MRETTHLPEVSVPTHAHGADSEAEVRQILADSVPPRARGGPFLTWSETDQPGRSEW